MEATFKAGDFVGTVWWLSRLRRAGLKLSPRGYAKCVNACRELGNPKAARQVFDAMMADGVVPKIEVYNAVLDALCFSFAVPPDFYSNRRRREGEDEAAATTKAEGGAIVQTRGAAAWGIPVDENDVDVGAGAQGTVNELERWVDIEANGDDRNDVSIESGGGGGGDGGGHIGEDKGDVDRTREAVASGHGATRTGSSRHLPHPQCAEWSEDALGVLRDMRARGVRPDAITYSMVATALMSAEREADVVELWKQVSEAPRLCVEGSVGDNGQCYDYA